MEVAIIDKAFEQGWVHAQVPVERTGKKVVVVGSGPAGLAAAEQLNWAGHLVTVFERDDRIGGLLRYGIPEFKMEKRVLDRRLAIMAEAGVQFRTDTNVGVNLPVSELRAHSDAVVLAGGACHPRDLPVPGRELDGIHFAMDYLKLQNRRCEGDTIPDVDFVSAKGRRGRDHRRWRYRSRLPSARRIVREPHPCTSSSCSHNRPSRAQRRTRGRSGRTSFAPPRPTRRGASASSRSPRSAFIGDGNGRVKALEAVTVEILRKDGRVEFRPVPGSEVTLPADLVLLAMGFVGPERPGMLSELGVELTDRGNVWRDGSWMTSTPGVFACGDMQRGQSLIVWAIADGRSAARGVDAYLMGASSLPAPLA